MRDTKRIDKFCDTLAYYWKNYVPDWRFGQLICNIFNEMVSSGRDPFFPEEEEMTGFIKQYFKKMGNEQ